MLYVLPEFVFVVQSSRFFVLELRGVIMIDRYDCDRSHLIIVIAIIVNAMIIR